MFAVKSPGHSPEYDRVDDESVTHSLVRGSRTRARTAISSIHVEALKAQRGLVGLGVSYANAPVLIVAVLWYDDEETSCEPQQVGWSYRRRRLTGEYPLSGS